jgi:phosphatidylglycerol---prolipoprotein diacylglyceryl transferase
VRPVWFYLLGYPVHMYAVMIAVGFVIGIWLAVRYGERVMGYDREMVLDLSWWILVSGLVGARLAFIAVNWDQYYYACADFELYNARFPALSPLDAPDCTRIVRFWTGGLVFYGGVIGAIGTIVWFMRRERLPVLPMTDVIIPSLAIGQFFGRMGCLGAGCCWGKPTDGAIALTFPKRSMVFEQQLQEGIVAAHELHSHAVFPTQLFDSLGGLLLFGLLLWVRHRKRFHGQVFVVWLLVYPLLRSTVELFRGDTERGYLVRIVSEPFNQLLGLPAGSPAFLSTSQFISLGVMAAAGALLWFQRRRPAPD